VSTDSETVQSRHSHVMHIGLSSVGWTSSRTAPLHLGQL